MKASFDVEGLSEFGTSESEGFHRSEFRTRIIVQILIPAGIKEGIDGITND